MKKKSGVKKRHILLKIAATLLLAGVIVMAVFSTFFGLPDNSGRKGSEVISSQDSAATKLGKESSEELDKNPGLDGMVELPDGRSAYVARAVLAQQAEKSIDTQYYMWHQDTVGRLLVFELINAADRGVRVRLLVDDMYGSDGQDTWLAMDTHPMIEVRLFAPFSRRQPKYLQFITRFHNVNARMHTKTFTVDNVGTIVGGRNIGDEYFDADPDLAFADNDVLAIGPSVDVVSQNFNDYWNSDYAYPVSTLLPAASEDDLNNLRNGESAFRAKSATSSYVAAADQSDLANGLRDGTVKFKWGKGTIVHDAWWKRDQKRDGWDDSLLITQLRPYLNAATEELIMISPYFVPEQKATDAFCKLAASGTNIKVLTNSLASNDVVAVHAGYSKFRKQLLRCGVELYELDEHLNAVERRSFSWLPGLSKSSLHAKTMIIDKKEMFVGSFNFDQRSLYLNTEVGLVFEQLDLASKTSKSFDANIEKAAFRVELVTNDKGKESLVWHGIENGQTVTLYDEPYVGRGTKLAVWFMRLLPIDWLL